MLSYETGIAKDFIQEDELKNEVDNLKEDLNILNEKMPKRKKKFLISLLLFTTSVILSIIITAVLGTNKKPIEYSDFNPDGSSGDYVCVEVSRILTAIEETSNSGESYVYMIYEAPGSPYNHGLIKISDELSYTSKVRKLINYSENEISEPLLLSDTVPDPITFYGKTCKVTDDLNDWITYQSVSPTGFPRIDTGKVYLSGGIEPGVEVSAPFAASIFIILALVFLVVLIVFAVKYVRSKNRRNEIIAILEYVELAEE